MDTRKNFFLRNWRPAAVVLGLLLLGYVLYFHRLGTLLPGYSSVEIQTVQTSANWHEIAKNPVDAPYKGLVWLLTAILHHGLIAARIVSATFGLVTILVFFAIVRRLFSLRLATLGTLLFATSAGFLHFARLGTPHILQMAVLVLIGVVLWYRRTEYHKVALGYFAVLLCAVLCYIPGLIWYELLGLLLLRSNFRRRLTEISPVHVIGYILLFLAALAPLLLAGAHEKTVLLSTAGLPGNVHQLSHFFSNFLHGLASIGVHSDGNPLIWVGHAPLLNIVELVLGAMGIYTYVYRERSIRTIFMLGAIVISLVLIGFGNLVGYAAMVPLLYIFVVGGLNHLLRQWLAVFPRNPFAKYVGVGLIGIMLFFSVLYQVRSYFVAWPHNTVTQHEFHVRRPS